MKKGFTLIEIMVVIVIMGVLAAVGVPKLFGMIAKAKASEVPTAAGTYVHLQEAYQSEKTIIGSWKNIGYNAPGTNGVSKEFQYSGCLEEDTPFTGEELTVIGWKATNRNTLNQCSGNNGTWAVQVSAVAERNLSYTNLVSSADCGMLTVNWAVSSISDECEGSSGNTQQASSDPEPQQQQPEQQPEEQTQSSPSQDGVCRDGTPCSNDGQCNRGKSGKDKDKSHCSQSNHSGCCFCCQ
jgi:prepilin-type N-terminal cleavage/methylation domain-containing protein